MYNTTWRLRAASIVAVLAGLTMVAAACGSETTTEELAAPGDNAASDGMADGAMAEGHDHGAVIDVPEGMAVPAVAIRVEADPKSGHNLFVELENFEISPENASSDPVDGQGHLHLYVDGERKMRFYNTELHLGSLAEGEREIAVEVSANNHSAYGVGGVPIRASETVVVDVSGGHNHDEMAPHEVAAAGAPSVTIDATVDPKSGWNLQFPTEGIKISAEAASTEHVDGEGHMHLYVDGVKLGRMYGEWWHLSTLTEGEHEVTIELNGNDHAPYAVGGEPITATTTISATAEQAAASMGDEGQDHDGDHDAMGDGEHDGGEMAAMADGAVVEATYAGGNVAVESERMSVPLGSQVTVRVTSDVAEEVHVHGYDLHADVGPGLAGEVTFVAQVPGLFEVELEESKLFLFELAVE
jgi:heme/copper-type cytochrome/quinol oxidase subunit 2